MKWKTKALSIILVLVIILTTVACSTKSNDSSVTTQQSNTDTPAQVELDYPKKPIELVVGYAAGGGTHLAAELLTPGADGYLGQPLNITCKPGAGGAVGATYVAKSKPDGYTLLYATLSLPISLAITDVDFVQEDFVGVAMASDIPPIIAVREDAPFNNATEMVEWTKENPGKLTWGFPGVGSSLHLTGANAFEAMGITDLVQEVPFDGTAESVAGVLGGHITAVSCFTTSISEQLKAGQMKLIGIQAQERVAEYPDTPTFLEQGYEATLTSWRGVFAPKDTPKEILEYLEKSFAEIINNDEYLERATELGEGRAYLNSEEFTEKYNNECESIKVVTDKLGLSIN